MTEFILLMWETPRILESFVAIILEFLNRLVLHFTHMKLLLVDKQIRNIKLMKASMNSFRDFFLIFNLMCMYQFFVVHNLIQVFNVHRPKHSIT